MALAAVRARRGFNFQDLVALYHLLDLLEGKELISVEIESTGLEDSSEAVYVDDIVLRYRNGTRKYVQVKMAAEGMKNWSMQLLKQAGELDKIVKQLSICPSDYVELVCPHGFGDLEELKKDNRNFHDLAAFKRNPEKRSKDRLNTFCVLTGVNDDQAFNFVRRLGFGSRHQEMDWKSHILTKLSYYVENPDQAYAILLALVIDHQCKQEGAPGTFTADVIRLKLSEASIIFSKNGKEVYELREWKGDALVRRSSWGERLVHIGKSEPEEIKWKRDGPQFFLALRPKKAIETLSIDEMEEKVCSDGYSLPTFITSVEKKTARVKDGLCVYDLWVKPADEPTFFQKILSKISPRYMPVAKSHILTFTYLSNSGEIWLSYAFRLKSRNDEWLKNDKEVSGEIPANVERMFAMALNDARNALRVLGVQGPYEGIAHISGGISDCVLPMLDEYGAISGKKTSPIAEMEVEKNFVVASSEIASSQALSPFFGKLWEALHTRRPSYYDELHFDERLQVLVD